MPNLKRRWWRLTVIGILLGGCLVPMLSHQLVAEAAGVPTLPIFDWLSLSGVASLLVVAVQWGEVRQQLKGIDGLKEDHKDAIDELREEMREGFHRIDVSVNTLYELAGTNRRTFNRDHFGVRAARGEDETRDGQQHD